MIKQHPLTGLKYFCKTTKPDPFKYLGSGKYWKRHLKKYGKENIITCLVMGPYSDPELINKDALYFSEQMDIVNSSEWANLIPENGLDGGARIITDETKLKMSTSRKGKTHSRETLEKMSTSQKGKKRKPLSNEHKAKIGDANRGRSFSVEHKNSIRSVRKGKKRIFDVITGKYHYIPKITIPYI